MGKKSMRKLNKRVKMESAAAYDFLPRMNENKHKYEK